ncbi:hypothetical protein F4820DRAFT_299323 [Hypoxylon rubiginosum]|uniref:Uncharacterized protein n=1 Tax=Hypoxylon rubiginosum TaxID=110542 RepID=A0ACB9Z0R4_9PEZI|nr:hypothetical protein F4820DRAFT_299323 [Hypoxylon rubiginosum]
MKATSASLLAALFLPALPIVSALPKNSGEFTYDEISQYYAERPITNTCGPLKFRDGHLLDASCVEPYWYPNGYSVKTITAFDLNDCLANRSGDLEFARGGDFASSCQDCELSDGGALTCECAPGGDRVTNRSTFDLGDCRYFQNVAGTLTCNDVGTACPNPDN